MAAANAEGCQNARSNPGAANLLLFILNTILSGGATQEGGGATSQLDIPSLTPLSVASCGLLQLGVPQWATSLITANS